MHFAFEILIGIEGYSSILSFSVILNHFCVSMHMCICQWTCSAVAWQILKMCNIYIILICWIH